MAIGFLVGHGAARFAGGKRSRGLQILSVVVGVLVVGLWTLIRRWRDPEPGYDALPRRQRIAIGLAYAGLVIALVATL